jgi:hypothetical protein
MLKSIVSFTTASLLAGLLLPMVASEPARSENLNPMIEEMCQGMAILNAELGASATPGSPASARMQKELALTQAQYGALWSLMKLTPTPACQALY